MTERAAGDPMQGAGIAESSRPRGREHTVSRRLSGPPMPPGSPVPDLLPNRFEAHAMHAHALPLRSPMARGAALVIAAEGEFRRALVGELQALPMPVRTAESLRTAADTVAADGEDGLAFARRVAQFIQKEAWDEDTRTNRQRQVYVRRAVPNDAPDIVIPGAGEVNGPLNEVLRVQLHLEQRDSLLLADRAAHFESSLPM